MIAIVADLLSDTLTRPTRAMRHAMASAEVGDDVFGEDPTVRELEQRVAGLLGHEDGLFTPTGSLANQLGMRLQRALRVRLRQQQGALTPLAQRLHTVSPLATLGRGYAIVTGPAGIIRRAASIAPGTAVIATVAEGRLHCTVTHTEDATQT